MAPRPKPWFRFYTEAVHDRKLRRLTPAQRWLWVAILAAARQSCRPGHLLVSEHQPMEPEDLADFAGMRTRDVIAALPRMESAGMLERSSPLSGWVVRNWAERQFESDSSTPRVRRHRSASSDPGPDVTPMKRRMERSSNADVTADVTPPETETETEETPCAVPARQERDPLWSAVLDACGVNTDELTPQTRRKYGAAVALIRGAKGTPEQVPQRAEVYRTKFSHAALTPHALANHWPELDPALQRNGNGGLRSEPALRRALARGGPRDP